MVIYIAKVLSQDIISRSRAQDLKAYIEKQKLSEVELAITAFEEALNIPYVDPELIHMHARRLRLIGAALGGTIEWLIRFMEGKRPESI